jgi:hypothetical protein
VYNNYLSAIGGGLVEGYEYTKKSKKKTKKINQLVLFFLTREEKYLCTLKKQKFRKLSKKNDRGRG